MSERGHKKSRWQLHCKAMNDADADFHSRHIFAIHGVEEISRPYQFDVGIAIHKQPGHPDRRVSGLVMCQRAWLQLEGAGNYDEDEDAQKPRIINGIIGAVESLGSTAEAALYRISIVPKMWKMTLSRHSRTWKDATVKQVIREILGEYKIHSDLDKLPDRAPRKRICQFDETDFDFVSRWLEREGWFYYFQQKGMRDVLHIVDSVDDVAKLFPRSNPPDGEPAEFAVSRAHVVPEKQVATLPHAPALGYVHNKLAALPQDVRLRQVRAGKSQPLERDAEIDSGEILRSKSRISLYGENLDGDDPTDLVRRRADELASKRTVLEASGTVQGLVGGHLVRMVTSKASRCYLLTRVEHWFQANGELGKKMRRRAIARLQRHEPGSRMELSPLIDVDSDESYQVAFECIGTRESGDKRTFPSFRPPRTTPIPRVHSAVRAKYSAKSGTIVFDFDERATEVAAPRELPPGMHFPMADDTRVLVKFADGDIDQPYVTGMAPDEVIKGPQGNAKTGVIESQPGPGGRQNRLVMDDDAGTIALESSADALSYLRLGKLEEGSKEWNAKLYTKGTTLLHSEDRLDVRAGGESLHHYATKHEVVVGDASAQGPTLGTYRRTLEGGKLVETAGEAVLHMLRHEQRTAVDHTLDVGGTHRTRLTGANANHATQETIVAPGMEKLTPVGSYQWQHRTFVGENNTDKALHETTVNGFHKVSALSAHMRVLGPYALVAESYSLSAKSGTIENAFDQSARGTQTLRVRAQPGAGDNLAPTLGGASGQASRLVDVEGVNWTRVGFADGLVPSDLKLAAHTVDVNGGHWLRVGAGLPLTATLAPPCAYTIDVSGSIAAQPTDDYLVKAGKNVSVKATSGHVGVASKTADIHAAENLQLHTDRLDINAGVCYANAVLFVFN